MTKREACEFCSDPVICLAFLCLSFSDKVVDLGILQLNDFWTSSVDNTFVKSLFRKIKSSVVLPLIPDICNICENCAILADIWAPAFSLTLHLTRLQSNQEHCQLCAMFLDCVKKHKKDNIAEVKLYRVGSAFCFNRDHEPVLSIIGHPGTLDQGPFQYLHV